MSLDKLIPMVTGLLGFVPDSLKKEVVDTILDKIEDAVAKSPNKIDDVLVKPVMNAVRKALDIDDSKYGTDKQ